MLACRTDNSNSEKYVLDFWLLGNRHTATANRNEPCPGGVMYVLRGLDNTTPSFMMPMPSLLALPSKPIAITIVDRTERHIKTSIELCISLYIIINYGVN